MGGAFFHATARDWARFGTLYLRDGMWEDRRILPEGWVDHARTPGPAPNSGIYGGHFWVNSIPSVGQWNMLPSAPSEVFAAEGAGFQLVAMDPTRDLVFVRLGEAPFENFAKLRRLIGETIILFPVRDTPSHETSSGTTP